MSAALPLWFVFPDRISGYRGLTGWVGVGKVRGMSVKKRVLFVCTGNTCRSPMAEALFRKAVEGRDDYEVGSAGVAAADGGRCSRETAEVCEAMDASLEGFRSRQVSRELLEDASHVFTMTGGHLSILERRFPEFSHKYYLVCEFVDVPGEGYGSDVPDPIGMGKAAYRDVAEVLELAIPAIVDYVDRTVK